MKFSWHQRNINFVFVNFLGPSSLNSLLEENLHSALTSLPRLMRTADDVKKIQSLNHVLGYMSLLENRLSSLLNSSSHLKRLSLALVQVYISKLFCV